MKLVEMYQAHTPENTKATHYSGQNGANRECQHHADSSRTDGSASIMLTPAEQMRVPAQLTPAELMRVPAQLTPAEQMRVPAQLTPAEQMGQNRWECQHHADSSRTDGSASIMLTPAEQMGQNRWECQHHAEPSRTDESASIMLTPAEQMRQNRWECQHHADSSRTDGSASIMLTPAEQMGQNRWECQHHADPSRTDESASIMLTPAEQMRVPAQLTPAELMRVPAQLTPAELMRGPAQLTPAEQMGVPAQLTPAELMRVPAQLTPAELMRGPAQLTPAEQMGVPAQLTPAELMRVPAQLTPAELMRVPAQPTPKEQMGVPAIVKLSFLVVGHNHEDVDQFISRISTTLKRSEAITLPELIDTIEKAYTPSPEAFHIKHVAEHKGNRFDRRNVTKDSFNPTQSLGIHPKLMEDELHNIDLKLQTYLTAVLEEGEVTKEELLADEHLDRFKAYMSVINEARALDNKADALEEESLTALCLVAVPATSIAVGVARESHVPKGHGWSAKAGHRHPSVVPQTSQADAGRPGKASGGDAQSLMKTELQQMLQELKLDQIIIPKGCHAQTKTPAEVKPAQKRDPRTIVKFLSEPGQLVHCPYNPAHVVKCCMVEEHFKKLRLVVEQLPPPNTKPELVKPRIERLDIEQFEHGVEALWQSGKWWSHDRIMSRFHPSLFRQDGLHFSDYGDNQRAVIERMQRQRRLLYLGLAVAQVMHAAAIVDRAIWEWNRSKNWWDETVVGTFTDADWQETFRVSRLTFDYLCDKLRARLQRLQERTRDGKPVLQMGLLFVPAKEAAFPTDADAKKLDCHARQSTTRPLWDCRQEWSTNITFRDADFTTNVITRKHRAMTNLQNHEARSREVMADLGLSVTQTMMQVFTDYVERELTDLVFQPIGLIGLKPPHHLVFAGPPGTGKTTMGDAFASCNNEDSRLHNVDCITRCGDGYGRMKVKTAEGDERVVSPHRTDMCLLQSCMSWEQETRPFGPEFVNWRIEVFKRLRLPIPPGMVRNTFVTGDCKTSTAPSNKPDQEFLARL
ncbi:hypothetical protein Bbelb_282990 [Branchiostoma belcheri]|nr:hypothetical protein Bbelb_282990 [Branchiostoma belcheri]